MSLHKGWAHLVCGCKVLAQKEYKRRHDSIPRILHWMLCGRYDLKRVDKWYEYYPEGILRVNGMQQYNVIIISKPGDQIF